MTPNLPNYFTRVTQYNVVIVYETMLVNIYITMRVEPSKYFFRVSKNIEFKKKFILSILVIRVNK